MVGAFRRAVAVIKSKKNKILYQGQETSASNGKENK